MSELRIEKIWKEYGDQIVLEDVSLTRSEEHTSELQSRP